MDKDTKIQMLEQEVNKLKESVALLANQVNKNQFSNLYVFDEQVQFRSNLIFPKLDTPIATSTTDSTGKIAIKDDTGAVRYIPYFT